MQDVKHVVIGGGSGFIGTELAAALRARGDRVTLVSRHPGADRLTWGEVERHGLPPCHVVINLAGKHILDMSRPWTQGYQNEVLQSRIETTEILVKAINQMTEPPGAFISTAGKCFYGSQSFKKEEQYFDLDERSEPIGIDYPAELVAQWEAAANQIDSSRVRHVKLRLGIVLARKQDGVTYKTGARGIFPMLQSVFDKGLCFSMGSGVQPFPWVHVDDVVGVCLNAIDQAEMHGIYNVVAPGIVSNSEFTAQLAAKLQRPVLGHIPAWLIKTVVGVQRSTILLLGQRVKPTRTLESGYEFRYPHLEACLEDLVPRLGDMVGDAA